MVNFRAPSDSLALYDQAAEAAGMSRSAWLRNAAELALKRFRDSGATPVVKQLDEAPKQCLEGNARGCAIADWRRLPTGIYHCGTCDIKSRTRG